MIQDYRRTYNSVGSAFQLELSTKMDHKEVEDAIIRLWATVKWPQNEGEFWHLMYYLLMKQMSPIELEHCTVTIEDDEILTEYRREPWGMARRA